MKALPARFRVKVVGVSFVDTYPGNLHRLASAVGATYALEGGRRGTKAESAHFLAADASELLPAILTRNPQNPHDRNAVEVHSPVVGMLGHIPRELAARLAGELDGGERWRAGVLGVAVNPEHPNRPGVWVFCERVDS